MDNKTPPIGPLAIALHLRGASKRTVLIVAALSCCALLIGVHLLLT
ncbi:hypothetical protein [Streptomyces broussonetiae]|uniref:Uncharacterized protein n=1 Tax=Streptomyces broussonetiae TaxID=2686304 RepID=A0ABV5EM72_9ACTN